MTQIRKSRQTNMQSTKNIDPAGRLPGDILIDLRTHQEYEVLEVRKDELSVAHYLVSRYGRPEAKARWRASYEFMRN